MVQNVVFVLMMIIAVGAGVVTAEVARPGKDKKPENSQAAEKKE